MVPKFVRTLLEFALISTVLVLFLLYSPLFLNCEPQSYKINLPKTFEGGLAPNKKLSLAEKYLEGEIRWPESLAVHEGNIYTGVNDGHIVKIVNGKIIPILRTGKKDCEGQWEEEKCGRPLGMRFHQDGTLYVVDAFNGLLAVDVKKKKYDTLLPATTKLENFQLTFFNDLAFDNEGVIYMTQSSTNWNLTKTIYSILEHDTTGRLLSFNQKTKAVKVLANGLGFPNGVELSEDGQKLYIAECTNHRILQYHLSGAKKGQIEPFISDLPGEPDNIRRSSKGGYWVALNGARTDANPTLIDKLAPYPAVRKVIMRLLYTVGASISYVSQYLNYPAIKSVGFEVESARFLVDLAPSYGMVLRFDDRGTIVESLHSPDGKIAFLSQVLEHDKHLYIGSWRNKFLAKLKVM